MRILATFALFGATLGCSLVGFDDLVTEPCAAVSDDSIEAIRAGNELCASLEAMRPAAEGSTWVCREPIGDDLFCVQSSADNDNDGVGTTEEGGLDCDDTDPDIFGGQEELLCDGKDNDCDGVIDENLLGVQGEPTRIYDEAVALGSFSSGADKPAFIGRRTSDERVVVVLDDDAIESDQAGRTSYAAAPVGSQAITLTRAPGDMEVYALSRTDNVAEATMNLADEDISFPAIGVGETSFVAAWFTDDAAACGAPAGPLRHTSGRSSNGIDTAPPIDLPNASPIQAPAIIPVGGNEFLVFAANGSDVDAHLVTAAAVGSTVVSSVSFPFDDTVSGFAVATGETDGDTLALGLSVVVGCGRRVLVFRELLHDLTTGMTSLGELALTEEGGDPPGSPSIRWSAAAPRGFVVTWMGGDAQRTFMARVVVDDGFAGPAFELGADIPAATAFPYGAAISPATGGGLRVWTYAGGPSAGVYEIALGCNMD
ncbi:MAG: putative metal-binding motif-containing protein [Polyangiales bacterium]